jgi:hypothetical protein
MRKKCKGLDGRKDIYKMARVLSRDTSPSSKRLPKYPPYQHHSITTLELAFRGFLTNGSVRDVYIRLTNLLYTHLAAGRYTRKGSFSTENISASS